MLDGQKMGMINMYNKKKTRIVKAAYIFLEVPSFHFNKQYDVLWGFLHKGKYINCARKQRQRIGVSQRRW